MAIVEVDPSIATAKVEVTPEVEYMGNWLGQNLRNPRLTEDEYLESFCGFINACQDMYFGEGVESQFATYDDMYAQVTERVTAATGQHGHSFDVRERIVQYWNDDRSQELQRRGYPAAPRVMTLALADMIDDHLPLATARRWGVNA